MVFQSTVSRQMIMWDQGCKLKKKKEFKVPRLKWNYFAIPIASKDFILKN